MPNAIMTAIPNPAQSSEDYLGFSIQANIPKQPYQLWHGLAVDVMYQMIAAYGE